MNELIKLLKPAVGGKVIFPSFYTGDKLIIYANLQPQLILCSLVGDGNLRVAHQRLLIRNLQRIQTGGLQKNTTKLIGSNYIFLITMHQIMLVC